MKNTYVTSIENMDKPKLYVDMDQVLNKFWRSFSLSLLEKGYIELVPGKKQLWDQPFFDKNFYQQYDLLRNFPEIEEKNYPRIYEHIFSESAFWETITVMNGAQEYLKKLQYEYYWDIYIVTAPWVGYGDCFIAKIKWMDKHFPFIDRKQIIFMQNKSLLRGGIMIDDAPKYLESFQGTKIAFDYSYNRQCLSDYRTDSWKSIYSYLKGVAEYSGWDLK